MSTPAGRVLTGLTRAAVSRGIFIRNDTSTVSRLNSMRSLALSSQRSAKSTDEEIEVKSEPIKFSTSKASHRIWTVEHSFGSHQQLPWWKVLPPSLIAISFLLWCVLREETDMDAKLEQHLFKNFPGLLSDEENEQNKSR